MWGLSTTLLGTYRTPGMKLSFKPLGGLVLEPLDYLWMNHECLLNEKVTEREILVAERVMLFKVNMIYSCVFWLTSFDYKTQWAKIILFIYN